MPQPNEYALVQSPVNSSMPELVTLLPTLLRVITGLEFGATNLYHTSDVTEPAQLPVIAGVAEVVAA